MQSQLPIGIALDSPMGELLLRVHELRAANQTAEAVALVRNAITISPNHARLLTTLGSLLVETGNVEQALEPLQRAVLINPRAGVAHWQLGVALQAVGDKQGAIDALKNAAALRTDVADIHLRLGYLYNEKNRRRDALESYRKAAAAAPNLDERRVIEAQVKRMEGNDDEAESLLRDALTEQPDSSIAHGALGQVLYESGRFVEAVQHFEAQLTHTPLAGLCFYDLVRCKKITESDEQLLHRMGAALTNNKLDDINRSILLLAQGKALDDLGHYIEAMQAFDSAFKIRERLCRFNMAAFEKEVNDIIELFDSKTLARLSSDNNDHTPVVIIGMPRSGTTLAEQIVSSHSQVEGGGELAFWQSSLKDVLVNPQFLSKTFLDENAAECLSRLKVISTDAQRVIDKNPFNFLAVGLIHMTFPKSAIIHCRRNAIDTALSIYQTQFSEFTNMPTGGEDLVRYIWLYQRLMEHWRQVLPKNRFLEIDYESLVTSPHSEIRRVIDYLGLPWDASCLTPHVNNRLVKTPSGWQVRQSINTSSVGRWRNYEPWLGPLAQLREAEDTSPAS